MENASKKDACLKGTLQDCFDVLGHTCSFKCLLTNPDYSELKIIIREKKIPFLALSMLLGWQRLIVSNERSLLKGVIYLSPCQKSFWDFNDLHEYLILTGCTLPINFFSFKEDVNIRNVFVSEGVTLITDISEGKELLPISVVNIYDSKTDTLANKYLTDFTYDESVKRNDDSNFLVCCNCPDDCKDKLQCPCFQLTLQNCDPQTKAKYNVHEIGYSNKLLKRRLLSGIFECSRMCKCRQSCMNRVVQLGTMFHLQIFRTFNKGWGVRTLHDIPEGSYVCRYIGKLKTVQKASKIKNSNDDWKYMASLRVAQPFKDGYEEYVREPRRVKRKTNTDTKSKNSRTKKSKKLTCSKKNVMKSRSCGKKDTVAIQSQHLKINRKIADSQHKGIGSSPRPRLFERKLRNLRIQSTAFKIWKKRNHPAIKMSSRHRICQFVGAPIKLGRSLVATPLTPEPCSSSSCIGQPSHPLASMTGQSIPASEALYSSLTSFTSDKTFQINTTATLTDTPKRNVICKGNSTDPNYDNLFKINNKSCVSTTLKRSSVSSIASKGTSGIYFKGAPVKNYLKLKQSSESSRSGRKYNLRPPRMPRYTKYEIGNCRNFKNRSILRIGKFITDAKLEGNVGRYINHSCEPNIYPQLVFTESQDLNFPLLALFSSKDIKAGTELTWDYNYEVENESTSPNIPCYCESKTCKGRLC